MDEGQESTEDEVKRLREENEGLRELLQQLSLDSIPSELLREAHRKVGPNPLYHNFLASAGATAAFAMCSRQQCLV